jgi:uncharacterized protein (DUF427 family)
LHPSGTTSKPVRFIAKDILQVTYMAKAVWNGVVLAESNNTIVVEGNHYFPPDAINRQFFRESNKHTLCPWKGTASYYNIEVNGSANIDAAWYYPVTKPAAKHIAGHVAFWRGVKIEP